MGTGCNEDDRPVYGKSPLTEAFVVFRAYREFIDRLLRVDCERLSVLYRKYRCPFNIITQFDQWIEWKKREHGYHHPTGRIMYDMVLDMDAANEHEIVEDFSFRFSMDCMPVLKVPRSIVSGVTF